MTRGEGEVMDRAAQCRRTMVPGQLTRRRFIGGIALLGGGPLLAACGPLTTPTSAPSSPAPTVVVTAVSTPTTKPTTASVAGTPATTAQTIPPAAPSIRAPAAMPNVAGASTTELGRMLGLVPQLASLPGNNGIWFADIARQKRNYGFAALTSSAAAQAQPGGLARFSNVVGKLPLPTEAGVSRALDQQWRATLGYDFWQIERAISGGDPPRTWARLEGALDRATIEAALRGQGYTTTPYRDHDYLARLGDGEIRLSDPLGRLVLSRLNRVALEDGALACTPYTAAIEAGIDAADGRQPSFADDSDYAALALALGPVVGAILAPADGLYRPAAVPTHGATPRVARTATPTRALLRPYRLAGLGLRDDGTTHTMVVALVYPTAAEAQVAAPILHGRAENYVLLRSGQRLRERANPGEPTVVDTGSRAVLIQPFAIAAEADLALYVQLYTNRDLLFLAE